MGQKWRFLSYVSQSRPINWLPRERPGEATSARQRRHLHGSLVATQQSWKDSNDEWQSKTEWHRVVAFNRLGTALATLSTRATMFLSMECSSARSTSARTARARRPRPRRSRSGACARIPCVGSAVPRRTRHRLRPPPTPAMAQRPEMRRTNRRFAQGLPTKSGALFSCCTHLRSRRKKVPQTAIHLAVYVPRMEPRWQPRSNATRESAPSEPTETLSRSRQSRAVPSTGGIASWAKACIAHALSAT